MEIKGSKTKRKKNTIRRTVFRWVILGLGALLSALVIYTAINESQNQQSLLRRSYEFSNVPDWQQNFAEMKQDTIDTAIWRFEASPDIPGYNNELQAYTNSRDNVRIEQGTGLVLEAHKQVYQYPNDTQKRQFEYTSGRIDTLNSLHFEYGKVEATMKLPKGKGVWPAFWILSRNEIHTANKAFTEKQKNDDQFYLRNGEIDIMEYYGNNPSKIEGTVHTLNGSTSKSMPVEDATDSFHTYGIEVTPYNVIWTLDNVPYHTFVKRSNNPNDWPFGDNNRLYIILNLAMGGPAGPINDNEEPWRLEVSNVEFYDYTGKRPD